MKYRVKVTYSAGAEDDIVPMIDDCIKTQFGFFEAIEFTGSGYDLVKRERDLFFDFHINDDSFPGQPKDPGISD